MDEAARARDFVLALLEATMEADEDTKVLLQEAANASQDHTDLLQAINASLLQLVQAGLAKAPPRWSGAHASSGPFPIGAEHASSAVRTGASRTTDACPNKRPFVTAAGARPVGGRPRQSRRNQDRRPWWHQYRP